VADSSSGGSIGIGILDYPSSVKDDPNASNWIVAHLEPGSTVSQHIQVTNSSNTSMSVNIDPGAATNENGVFSFAAVGVNNELTSWTTVSPSSGLIPAHGTLTVSVTITVPSTATPSMHYGVIWAQVNGPATADGIAVINRVGIRMYNPVGNYVATTATPSAAPSTSTLTVTNFGSDWFRISGNDYQWIALGALLVAVLVLFIEKQWKPRRRLKNTYSDNDYHDAKDPEEEPFL
jgi:hypothetical protein